jgi:YgiT-type zinc finger domain-containing protein
VAFGGFLQLERAFGGCACGGTFEDRVVTVTMTVHDERIVLDDVPQGACPVCGSRVYKLAVLGRIEGLMKEAATSPARVAVS